MGVKSLTTKLIPIVITARNAVLRLVNLPRKNSTKSLKNQRAIERKSGFDILSPNILSSKYDSLSPSPRLTLVLRAERVRGDALNPVSGDFSQNPRNGMNIET